MGKVKQICFEYHDVKLCMSICFYETFILSFQMCTSLADEFDTIRREYWNYVSRVLTSKFGQSTTEENSGSS